MENVGKMGKVRKITIFNGKITIFNGQITIGNLT